MKNFAMRQLLSTSISLLAFTSLSTVAVTLASTPLNVPKIYLTQKLNCNNARLQAEINQCAMISYQKADKKLNQIYQQILSKLTGSRKEKLTAAQQAWINFRDTNCEFTRSGYEGGSIAVAIYFDCLETVTNQRIKQLQEYIQPVR